MEVTVKHWLGKKNPTGTVLDILKEGDAVVWRENDGSKTTGRVTSVQRSPAFVSILWDDCANPISYGTTSSSLSKIEKAGFAKIEKGFFPVTDINFEPCSE